MVNNKRLLIEKRYPFQCDCVRVFTVEKERPHQSLSQGFAEIIIMRTPGVGKPTNGENIKRKRRKKNSPRIPENLISPTYIDLRTTHVLNLANLVLFITKEVWEFIEDWLCCIKDDASSIFAGKHFLARQCVDESFLCVRIGNSSHVVLPIIYCFYFV